MPLEIRSADASFQTREDAEQFRLSGYFSVFGSPYQICPGVSEYVDPHAFDNALGGDIRALINHDTALVLGRTAANTLTLRTDAHGLFGEILINKDDTDAMSLYARVKRGDVSQCSFGFDILQDRTEWKDNGDVDYIITEVRLYEVSVVTFPAYAETNVITRSAKIDELKQSRLDAQKEALRNILRAARK